MDGKPTSRQAFKLNEIDQAVRFTEPVGPDHPFYIDFSNVRGDFEERVVYRMLNVNTTGGSFSFDPKTSSNQKVLFFLGGMRGSGKTSELAKYVQNLHRPECFFCVTCNIDEELDLNDVEYMDILIFQLEKLSKALDEKNVDVHKASVERMERWFGERSKEITQAVEISAGIEMGVGVERGGLLAKLVSLFGSFKTGLSGSKEWVNSIRVTLKNRFHDFANLFNEFVAEANIALRKQGLGQEVLFVIDGLEKTMTAEVRRRIVVDESNRLKQIKAYTIFTLPIELMKERQRLSHFSIVESFPFVKLTNRDGSENPAAIGRFEGFVYQRVEPKLFADSNLVREMILLSGGSPRELLRIIQQANTFADVELGKIDKKALDKAVKRLASQISQYLTEEELLKLKSLNEANAKNEEVAFDDVMQELLEKIIVMEYNDGSDKRVNPIVALSNLYKQHVLG